MPECVAKKDMNIISKKCRHPPPRGGAQGNEACLMTFKVKAGRGINERQRVAGSGRKRQAEDGYIVEHC